MSYISYIYICKIYSDPLRFHPPNPWCLNVNHSCLISSTSFVPCGWWCCSVKSNFSIKVFCVICFFKFITINYIVRNIGFHLRDDLYYMVDGWASHLGLIGFAYRAKQNEHIYLSNQCSRLTTFVSWRYSIEKSSPSVRYKLS